MKDEIRKLIEDMGLLEPVKLTKGEVEKLEKEYPDSNFPSNIKKIKAQNGPGFYYMRYPRYSDYTEDEIKLLIQIRSHNTLTKINGHLLFYTIIIILSLVVSFLALIT